MSTVYPTGIDIYTTKVDNVDVADAQDLNNLQDAMVAVQTRIGYTGNNNLAPIPSFINEVIAYTGTPISGIITFNLSQKPISEPSLMAQFINNGQYTNIRIELISPYMGIIPTSYIQLQDSSNVSSMTTSLIAAGPYNSATQYPMYGYFTGTSHIVAVQNTTWYSMGSGVTAPTNIIASYWHV